MGTTHLEIHTGKTKQIRAQEAVPTSPTPVAGDVFFDITTGAESLGLKSESVWVYVNALAA